MWNPEKMVYIVLFANQKERHRHREQANGRQGGQRGGMDCKTEIDIYTPLILCIKEMPNESLCIVGNCAQSSVVTYWETQKGGDRCVCPTDPLCRTLGTTATLYATVLP